MAIDPKTGLPIPDGFAGSKRERLANQYDYGTKTNEVADFAGSKKEREANKAKWNAKFGYPEGSPQNPRTAPVIKVPRMQNQQARALTPTPMEQPRNYFANLKAEEEKRSGTVSATAGKETMTLGSSPTAPTTPASPTGTPYAVGGKPTAYTGGVTAEGAPNPYTGGVEIASPAGTLYGVNQGIYSPENKQKAWEKAGGVGAYKPDAFYRDETTGEMKMKPGYVTAAPTGAAPTTPGAPTPTTPGAPTPTTPGAPTPGATTTPTTPGATTTPTTPGSPTAPGAPTTPTEFKFSDEAIDGMRAQGFTDEMIANLTAYMGKLQAEKGRQTSSAYQDYALRHGQIERNKNYYSNWNEKNGLYQNVLTEIRGMGTIDDETAKRIAGKYGITPEQVKDPISIFNDLEYNETGKKQFGVDKFNQGIEDLTRRNEQSKADMKTNLEYAEKDVNTQMEDVATSAQRNIDAMQATGVWTGAARSTGYQVGMDFLRQDTGRTLAKLKESVDRMKTATAKDLGRLTEEYNLNVSRSKQAFDDAIKAVKQENALQLVGLVDKYGAGSDSLTKALDEINEKFHSSSIDAFQKYVNAVKGVNDNVSSKIDTIKKLNDTIDAVSNKRYNEYVSNPTLLASTNMNSIMTEVNNGTMSEEKAEDLRKLMVNSVITTMANFGNPTEGDIRTAQMLIASGATPMEVVSQMRKLPQFVGQKVKEIKDLGEFNRIFYADGSFHDVSKYDMEVPGVAGAPGVPGSPGVPGAERAAGIGADIDINSVIDYSMGRRKIKPGDKEQLQCGELVNDYWIQATKKPVGMGNTLASKIAAIEPIKSDVPVIGGLFVSNPLNNNVGHTGIVVGVNADGSIDVLEANAKGSEFGEYPKTSHYGPEAVKKMRFSKSPTVAETKTGELVDLTSQRSGDGKGKIKKTGNVANDLNNPGNLIRGGTADQYAIGYVSVKSKDKNGNVITRDFLVFPSMEKGYEAVKSDLQAKIDGKSRVIKPSATLSELLDKWVGADKANAGYKQTVAQMSGYDLNSPIAGMDAGKILDGVRKAEGNTDVVGNDYSGIIPKSPGVTTGAPAGFDPGEVSLYQEFLADNSKIPSGLKYGTGQYKRFVQKAQAYEKYVKEHPEYGPKYASLTDVILPEKITEDAKKSYMFGIRMANDEKSIRQFEDEYADQWAITTKLGELMPSFLQTADRQMYEQAKREWINAVLRRESGAVIGDSEFKSADKQYFPQAGDSEEVIKQKQESRRTATKSMLASAGRDQKGTPIVQIFENLYPNGGTATPNATTSENPSPVGTGTVETEVGPISIP